MSEIILNQWKLRKYAAAWRQEKRDKGAITMTTISIEEAQQHLTEIIDRLQPGGDVIIVRENQPVAKLSSPPKANYHREPPGFMKGSVLYMSPDFDAPLDDFKEYME